MMRPRAVRSPQDRDDALSSLCKIEHCSASARATAPHVDVGGARPTLPKQLDGEASWTAFTFL
jgi:hypothetical protein